jgi:hypothetical protein
VGENQEMKALFGIFWIVIPLIAGAQELAANPEAKAQAQVQEKDKAKDKGKEISAVVRLIRANPETEVFFRDYKESLIIPKDSQHNKIFAACEESRKKGTPVKLTVDPVARRILGFPEATAATESSDMSVSSGTSGSH